MPALWYKSRTIEWDVGPYPAANAQAFFFLGGVESSPIVVYTDAAESSPHPNPVLADGNGRWPAVFIPYMESYGVRVLNQANVQLWLDDFIPNPNPVEVTAEPPPTGGVETGMFFWMPVNNVKTGYVRANGRTIGNTASSATERANDDTEDLFIFLWNSMSNAQAPVIPTRGPNAAGDFAANRQITLPDMRGATPFGLDDMGAAAGNYFSGLTFVNGSATAAGSFLGSNAHALTTLELPSHSHTGSTGSGGVHDHGGVTGIQSANHTHSGTSLSTSTLGSHSHVGTTDGETQDHTHNFSGTTNPTGAHNHTVGISGGAGGTTSAQPAATNVSNTVFTSTVGDHAHTYGGTSGGRSASHNHSFTTSSTGSHNHAVEGSTGIESVNHNHTVTASSSHAHTISAEGGGQPHVNIGRTVLGTWYIKL